MRGIGARARRSAVRHDSYLRSIGIVVEMTGRSGKLAAAMRRLMTDCAMRPHLQNWPAPAPQSSQGRERQLLFPNQEVLDRPAFGAEANVT